MVDEPLQAMGTGTPQAAQHNAKGIDTSRSLLPRYLTFAYTALIVYASLHPFSGWRAPGISPFIFLDATWPRYWTAFDVAVNIATYVPFGFLVSQTIGRRPGGVYSSVIAFVLGATLSFGIEAIQTYLPSRVPSNIDFFCNSIGAGLGATLSLACGRIFFDQIARAQSQLLAPAPHVEYGLVVTALWLLAQLSPETFLFGSGDLRHLLDITPALPYAAPSFFAMETGIIVSNTLAIGLIVRTILDSRIRPYRALLGFFVAALLIRTMAAAVLVGPQGALAWLTPGAGLGILTGGMVLSLALFLPHPLRVAIAGMTLMAGTVLVNLVPFNPYSVDALAAWRQGHFLNFNGLTRLAASFWPFLALPYLFLLGRRS